MRKARTVISSLALASLLSACAQASPQQGKRPDGPPPEAFAACEGHVAGDPVTFAGRDGESIMAICKEHDGKLVAEPKDAPRPPKR